MIELDGYNHTVYYRGVKLSGVISIIIDGNTVRVTSEYAHTGMGGGDCIGLRTSEYDLNDVVIKRRVKHEIHGR